MEVDDAPAPGVDTVENTDIASLVEALYEYTPRDLKSLLVPESAPNRNFRSHPCPMLEALTLLTSLDLLSAIYTRDTR
jgi:hypothetical protein